MLPVHALSLWHPHAVTAVPSGRCRHPELSAGLRLRSRLGLRGRAQAQVRAQAQARSQSQAASSCCSAALSRLCSHRCLQRRKRRRARLACQPTATPAAKATSRAQRTVLGRRASSAIPGTGPRPSPSPGPRPGPGPDLLLAAAFVSDAQYNRNIPFKTSPEAVRLYYLYNHWMMRTATYFFIFLNLSLALFEEPAVYPLPFVVTSVVEVLSLLVFFGRLTHFAKVTPRNVFWKDTKNICIMVAILLSLTDLAIYGVLRIYNVRSIRWSRIVRPIFLVNFAESRQIRRAFRSIRNTLPEITYVFLLFMFSLLMFSLMALKLFGERNLQTAEGLPYFRNYLEIVFDLYVLVTTANSPDVMMPAFDFSSWYALFFIAFVIVNTYIFMSLFLAVVYNNYKKHLKNEIRKLAYMKRRKMIEFVVREARWKQLVKLVAPDTSNSHRELLLRISDDEQKGFIDKKSFVQLADLLNIQVITLKIRSHPLGQWMPRVYQSAVSRFLRSMVRHRGFVWTYDVIILINAIFIALDEETPYISYAEWVFLTLYITEILLKVYTYEPRAFFGKTQFWNWFDTLIIFAALTATILNTTLNRYNSQQILDIVFILRVLRLIRIVDSIQRFRVIMNTLINIVPTMLTFGGLTLVVYCVFAIIGMELFHGKIQFFPPNSDAPHALECGNANNFNNFASSFIVLMELTVVNQWHDILCDGSVTVQPAKLYFIAFHIVMVIIIVNIFVSFILEAFFVEYSLEKSEVETAIEQKIQELGMGVQEDELRDEQLLDNMESTEHDLQGDSGVKPPPKGLVFKIASKRYRTVDALLQRMFEAEIPLEDEGPSLEEILSLAPTAPVPNHPASESAA
uniref:Ion transport domain-containing protein n=1 Tax=Melopsittacus undulatus TaxID=13146 RepID=A0A8C6IZ82_MELUD